MRPMHRPALAGLFVVFLAAGCDGGPSPLGPNASGSLTDAGTIGPASTHEAGHASLTPSSLEASLAPGATTTAAVDADLPGSVPRADVLFAFDLTGSMGEELSALKSNANAIMDAVAADVPDVRFGLVSHEDYAGEFTTSTADGQGCDYTGTYGEDNEEFDDAPYRVDQGLTGTTADVAAAIDGMSLGFGSDFGEPYARVWSEAWAELAGDPSPAFGPLGWRDGADRILVQFADAVPHGCDFDAPVGGISVGPYGADPGRDGTIGTADDPTVASALNGLAEHGITLVSIYSDGQLASETHPLWDAYAESTGGTNFSINADGTFPDGADPASAISSLITDQASSLDRLALEVCSADAGFSDWLVAVTPAEITGVELPATASFDLELGPPEGTEPGEYAFQLCLNGDGVEFGRVDVSITVTDGGTVDAVIDVKPGSDENPINVNKKQGVVPVAILGSSGFDVLEVDAVSLRFGPDGAEPAHELALSGLEDGHLEDVDGDGFTDLVTHYDAPATGLEPGDTEACLTGSLADGTAFEGCDEVRVFGTPGRGAR